MRKFFTLLMGALMASVAANAETLTIYPDAESKSGTLPFNIYYASNKDLHSQMIYPADQLTALKGKVIEKIAFNITRIGQTDWNCKGLTVKMGTTTQSSYSTKDYITEGLTVAANVEAFTLSKSITLPAQWEITLTEPFTYTGDNLVIDIKNTQDNGPRNWEFQGQDQTTVTGLSMKNSITEEKFLPTLVVDYSTPQQLSATLSAGELSFPLEFVGDEATTSVIKVTNTGNVALSGTVAVDNAPFEATPATITDLPGGESTDIIVTFKPTTEGRYTGTLTVAFEGIDPLTANLSGMAVDAPVAIRTIFNEKNYDQLAPARWNFYAEERATANNEFSDGTTEYDDFGTIWRFESAVIAGYNALLWKNANPGNFTDLYTRYYYAISPLAGGDFVIGGTLNDVVATGANIKAFEARYDEKEARFVIGKELPITWDMPLEQGVWSIGKGTVSPSTNVALLMNYAATSFFAADDKKDSINSIETSPNSATVEYYTLQGVRVHTPGAGLYIMRQGNTATKSYHPLILNPTSIPNEVYAPPRIHLIVMNGRCCVQAHLRVSHGCPKFRAIVKEAMPGE